MDILTLAGFIVGVGGIILGQHLEGGHLSSIMQFTAFLIVAGGTAGALLVAHPGPVAKNAVAAFAKAFKGGVGDPLKLIEQLVDFAKKARKEGVLALEAEAENVENPFLKKALGLVSSGTDPKLVKEILHKEIEMNGERATAAAKFWEAGGAFSPTIGIIGAVLGLIHVMENLSDASKLGAGIAVAFVATVYGVGMANLVLLPIGTKLKLKHRQVEIQEEMILEGVISIQAGDTPNVIQEKLYAVLDHKTQEKARGE